MRAVRVLLIGSLLAIAWSAGAQENLAPAEAAASAPAESSTPAATPAPEAPRPQKALTPIDQVQIQVWISQTDEDGLRELAALLKQRCGTGGTVKDGRIEQSNFHDYPVLRMDRMPKVETIVMPSGGFWGGVGEPTIAVAAPAVLNAIAAATGIRVRELPLKNHPTLKV